MNVEETYVDKVLGMIGTMSKAERTKVEAEIIKGLRWPVEPPVFDQLCENTVTAPVEIALVTKTEGVWKVLMAPRKADDPYFGGRMHIVGSVILPGRTFGKVQKILLEREVGIDLDKLKNKPVFIGKPIEFMKGKGFGECERGQEVTTLYVQILEPEEAAKIVLEGRRQFYDLNNLPVDTLTHHLVMLDMVRQHLLTGRAWLEAHQDQAIHVLNQITTAIHAKQGLPSAIFEAHLKTFKKISTEGVFLNSEGEIYLIQRPTLEKNPSEQYPEMWHSPGVTHTAIESRLDAMNRLLKQELGSNVTVVETHKVYDVEYDDTDKRGRYELQVTAARITGELNAEARGRWFKISEIPWDKLVESHRDVIIPAAITRMLAIGWIV